MGLRTRIIQELKLHRHTIMEISRELNCSATCAYETMNKLLDEKIIRQHSKKLVRNTRVAVYELTDAPPKYESDDSSKNKFSNYIFEYTGVGCRNTKLN